MDSAAGCGPFVVFVSLEVGDAQIEFLDAGVVMELQ